jgi:hypothetical protein
MSLNNQLILRVMHVRWVTLCSDSVDSHLALTSWIHLSSLLEEAGGDCHLSRPQVWEIMTIQINCPNWALHDDTVLVGFETLAHALKSIIV